MSANAAPSPEDPIARMTSLFALVVGLALISAFAALWGVQHQARVREAHLLFQLDSLRTALNSRRTFEGRGTVPPSTPELQMLDLRGQLDILGLQERGLADPIRDLKADLERHPELIPFPGELGGTMGFYDSSGVVILNDSWVFACFDDGHVDGSMLLEYSVDHGRIRWKRLAARRE